MSRIVAIPLGDQAGQHRDSRQQYLAFDQAGRGQIEEDAGSFGTDPGPVGDPAGQGGGLRALVEVAVAIATADLGGVIPAFLASCVASQAIGVVDVQLPGEVGHDSRGDFGQVGQEGAQKPHGPDLRGEPETVVITSASGDEATILVVEVEVAFELGGRWLARVAAIAPLLILGQEVDRHPTPFLKSPIRLGARCQIGSPSPRHRQTLEIIGFPEPRSCDKMGVPQLSLYKPGGHADTVRANGHGRDRHDRLLLPSLLGEPEDRQSEARDRRWLDGNRIDQAKVGWFEDKESGKTLKRPAFDRVQKAIFAGSITTVVVWKLDRISRGQRDGVNLLADWCERGVRVVAMTQQIDLSGPVGRMVASVLFGLAEIETEYRRERQAAGIAEAKKRGVYRGRDRGTTKAPPSRARELRGRGLTVQEIATALGVSRRTALRYLASAPAS